MKQVLGVKCQVLVLSSKCCQLLSARFPLRMSLARALWLDNGKLELALHGIDALQEHAGAIANGEFAAGALADDLAHVFVVGVAIARK